VRTILLSAVLGVGLVGFAGTAYAQEDPVDPPSSESSSAPVDTSTSVSETASSPGADDADQDEPPFVEVPTIVAPSVSTGSACEGGVGFMDVVITNPNDIGYLFRISLNERGSGVSFGYQTVTIAAGDTQTVTYQKMAAGVYDVSIRIGAGIVAMSSATVDRCGEITEPVDDPLQVFVRCENGEGLVTIRVFNTEGEARTFTVSVDDLELPGDIELGSGEYTVVVDEAAAPDGSYAVRVVAEGIDHSETVKVACAPAPTTAPTSSSAAPVPQPRPAADEGGLASTGAAVGGMALLAGLALVLGGGLVIGARRRRTTQSDSSES
jgi:hypothetical protein